MDNFNEDYEINDSDDDETSLDEFQLNNEPPSKRPKLKFTLQTSKRDGNIPWTNEQLQLLMQTYNKVANSGKKMNRDETFKLITAELSLQPHFALYTPINPTTVLKKFNREKKAILEKYALDREGANLSGLNDMSLWENILYKILEKEATTKKSKEEETKKQKLRNVSMLTHEQKMLNNASLKDTPQVLTHEVIRDAMDVLSMQGEPSSNVKPKATSTSSNSSKGNFTSIQDFEVKYDDWMLERDKKEFELKARLAEEEIMIQRKKFEHQLEEDRKKGNRDEMMIQMMTSMTSLIQQLTQK